MAGNYKQNRDLQFAGGEEEFDFFPLHLPKPQQFKGPTPNDDDQLLLNLFAAGCGEHEVARFFNVSTRTIRRRVALLRRHSHTANITALVAWAIRNEVI